MTYTKEFVLSLKNKYSSPIDGDEQLSKFIIYYNTVVGKPASSVIKKKEEKKKPTPNKIKRILNKISKNNYNILIDQLIEELNTNYSEAETVDLIMNKIWSDDSFYVIYLNVCKVIWQIKPSFKKALLNRCQLEFSQTDQKITKIMSTEDEVEKQKLDRVTSGTIKFIGHMFNIGIIKENILVECIRCLLKFNKNEITEKHIEYLDKLFDIVDKEKIKNINFVKCKQFIKELMDCNEKNRMFFILESLLSKMP